MITVSKNMSRTMRLFSMAIGLLFTQHVFAIGTPAGTSVSNTATASFQVGGVSQDVVSSTPTTFVVDQRVELEITRVGTATIATPGQTNAVVEFTITNLGNAPQDVDLSAINLVGGEIVFGGDADTVNVEDPPRVSWDDDDDGLFDPAEPDFVDELPALAGSNSARVFIVANIPVSGLQNGDFANVELTATAHDAGAAGLGAQTTDDSGAADDAAVVQVVFASTGGTEALSHSFAISAADVTVSKTSAVVDDFFSASNDKAIPGATVQYEITVTNNGAQDADNVGVIDPIDLDLVDVLLAQYNGGAADAEVEIDGSTTLFCTLDDGDADADGCGVTGTAPNVSVEIVPGSISLGGTISGTDNDAVFRFSVTID
ncbi:MAG: hypothetical protein AAGA44_15930 [Pseudomonadota bacterium]